jgi:hypothetical protein
MKERGQGRPEGAPKEEDRAPQKEQGGCRKESTANNPSGTLNSIRADQGVDTFVADLRQNKEQLLSLAQELISGEAVPAKTKKEVKDNIALGLYMDFAVRYISNPYGFAFEVFSTNPADWRDGYTYHKPVTEAEKRERLVDRAARRVASKWLDRHPDSGAAMHIEAFGINEVAPDIHGELLQEVWPAILPQLASQSASQSERKK